MIPLNKGCLLETRQIEKVQMVNSTEMSFFDKDCPLESTVHSQVRNVPESNQEGKGNFHKDYKDGHLQASGSKLNYLQIQYAYYRNHKLLALRKVLHDNTQQSSVPSILSLLPDLFDLSCFRSLVHCMPGSISQNSAEWSRFASGLKSSGWTADSPQS